jgi:chemotaxis protein CheX
MNVSEMFVPFSNSVKKIVYQMSEVSVNYEGSFYGENDDIVSYGVSSLISFSGLLKGRLLIDMEPGLALTIAQKINGTSFTSVKDDMVLASISELNNIIAGDGITELNNSMKLKLRLAPPIVFAGNSPIICIPKISSQSLNCTTQYGKLKINVAFERSR